MDGSAAGKGESERISLAWLRSVYLRKGFGVATLYNQIGPLGSDAVQVAKLLVRCVVQEIQDLGGIESHSDRLGGNGTTSVEALLASEECQRHLSVGDLLGSRNKQRQRLAFAL